MLEVTPDDISKLRDDELRELVARLCSAELAAKGLPTAGVTSGGAQDAPDGGIDVRVSTAADLGHDGWVPKPETGFQVKVPSMAPKALAAEMRPGRILRPSISDLAARGGAYVVASSGSNLTDDRLALALAAMCAAVADDPNADRLIVDIYDRDRLARWARDYTGVAAWTLAAAGRPNAGWGPPESLTGEPEGTTFVTAEDCAIVDGRAGGGRMPLARGLASMRAALASPRAALRLVGLSGLGKTRLVQALFEPEVGEAPLDRSIGLYAVLCDLVHHIAYDPDQFDEAAALLARFLAAEPEGHRTNSVRTSFEGLFQLQLSFTRASPAQRRASCRSLLSSHDHGLQAAGLAALSGLLRSGHFSSTHQAEFGARARDLGWRPSTRAEVRDWFEQALRLAVDARQVIAAERGFWRTDRHAPFLVTTAPIVGDPTVMSMGGTGRGDAFALWVDQRTPLDRMKWLLAHEYFHTWNSARLGTMPEDRKTRPAHYWFSEGFTDYYARALMVRAGLISPADYAAQWNEMLAAYAGSPVRTLSGPQAASAFWENDAAQKLAYQRGALLAAIWNRKLLDSSSGRVNLDTVMHAQLAAASTSSEYATDLFRQLADRSGLDIVADQARYLEHGELILLPADTFGACATIVTEQRPSFS